MSSAAHSQGEGHEEALQDLLRELEAKSDEDFIWERFFHSRFLEAVAKLRVRDRAALVARVCRLLQGADWLVNKKRVVAPPVPGKTKQHLEETEVILVDELGPHRLVWWVEFSQQHRSQAVVFHAVVDQTELCSVMKSLDSFMSTLSERYRNGCRKRLAQLDGKRWLVYPIPLPVTLELKAEFVFNFSEEARILEEEPDDPAEVPVSLQKRFEMQHRHLVYLARCAMRDAMPPYEFDEDEVAALSHVMQDVLFLLGRSGSGKTSVLVRALCAISRMPGPDGRALPVVLLTRSRRLAGAIRRLATKLRLGLAMADEHGSEALPADAPDIIDSADGGGFCQGLEAGSAGDASLPQSLLKEDYEPDGPLVLDFASFLRLADASVPGRRFFSPVGSAAEQATRMAGANTGFQESQEVTYEFFETSMAPELGLGKDSLFLIWKEFQMVIAGSLQAARSPTGVVSEKEYVTGATEKGDLIVEMKDSAFQDAGRRVQVYKSFLKYQALKKAWHRFDPCDPPRDIIARIRQHGIPRRHGLRVPGMRLFAAMLNDEAQDLLPVQIAMQKFFCPNREGFVFAGDTAQTITKGVDFKFESLRRLFFEYFLHDDGPKEEEPAPVVYETCHLCRSDVSYGSRFDCGNCSGRFAVCDGRCHSDFERACTDRHGATKGVRDKMDFASRWRKLPCPQCKIAMRESTIEVQVCRRQDAKAEAEEEEQEDLPIACNRWDNEKRLPPIKQLRYNHRSSANVLRLAASVIELLVGLFPSKIDALSAELPCVESATRPVVLSMGFAEAARFLAGDQGQATASLDFGAGQAVLAWSAAEVERAQQQLNARSTAFPTGLVFTIEECKGLEFQDVLLWKPFSTLARSVAKGESLWGLFGLDRACWASEVGSGHYDLLCSWLKTLYVAVTRARRRVWILEESAAGNPLVQLWASRELVQIVDPSCTLDQLRAVGGAFARASRPEDWMQLGHEMMNADPPRYDRAEQFFQFASRSPTHGWAAEYAELARARWHEFQARYHRDGPERSRLLLVAAELFERLSTGQVMAVRSRELLLQAAECRLELRHHLEAGDLYERAGSNRDAGLCFEVACAWSRAGECFERAGDCCRVLKCFALGHQWEASLQATRRWEQDGAANLRDAAIDFLRWLGSRDRRLEVVAASLPDYARDQVLEWCLALEPRESFQETAVERLPYLAFQAQWFTRHDLEKRALAAALKCLAAATSAAERWKLFAFCMDVAGPEEAALLSRTRTVFDLVGLEAEGQPAADVDLAEFTFGHQFRLRERRFGKLVQGALARVRGGGGRAACSIAVVAADFCTAAAAFEGLADAFASKRMPSPHWSAYPAEHLQRLLRSASGDDADKRAVCVDLTVALPTDDHCYVILGLPFAPSEQAELHVGEVARVASAVVQVLKVRVALGFAQLLAAMAEKLRPCWCCLATGEETCCRTSKNAHERGHNGLQHHAVRERVARALHFTTSLSCNFLHEESQEVHDALSTLGWERASALLGSGSLLAAGAENFPASTLQHLRAVLAKVERVLVDAVLSPPSPHASLVRCTAGMNLREFPELRSSHPWALDTGSGWISSAAARFVHGLYDTRRNPKGLLLASGKAVAHAVRLMALQARLAPRLKLWQALTDPLAGEIRKLKANPPKEVCLDEKHLTALRNIAGTFSIQAAAREWRVRPEKLRAFVLDQKDFLLYLQQDFKSCQDATEFPWPPATILHLLERLLVWATVGLTEFYGLLLPASLVEAHLQGHESLAYAVACCPQDRWEKKAMHCWGAICQVRDFIRLLVAAPRKKCEEWVEHHNRDGSGTLGVVWSRLTVLYFLCRAQHGTEDLLRAGRWPHQRTRIELADEAYLAGPTGAGLGMHPLLQRLASCLPEPAKVIQTLHAALGQLGDPLVALQRAGHAGLWLPEWAPHHHDLHLHSRTPVQRIRCQQVVEHVVFWWSWGCDFSSLRGQALPRAPADQQAGQKARWKTGGDAEKDQHERPDEEATGGAAGAEEGAKREQADEKVRQRMKAAEEALLRDALAAWVDAVRERMAASAASQPSLDDASCLEDFVRTWRTSSAVSNVVLEVQRVVQEDDRHTAIVRDALDTLESFHDSARALQRAGVRPGDLGALRAEHSELMDKLGKHLGKLGLALEGLPELQEPQALAAASAGGRRWVSRPAGAGKVAHRAAAEASGREEEAGKKMGRAKVDGLARLSQDKGVHPAESSGSIPHGQGKPQNEDPYEEEELRRTLIASADPIPDGDGKWQNEVGRLQDDDGGHPELVQFAQDELSEAAYGAFASGLGNLDELVGWESFQEDSAAREARPSTAG